MKLLGKSFGGILIVALVVGGCGGTDDADSAGGDGAGAAISSAEARYIGIYASGGRGSDGIGSLTILSMADTATPGSTSMRLQAMGTTREGAFVISTGRLTSSGGQTGFSNKEGWEIDGKLENKPLTNVELRMEGEIAKLTVGSKTGYATLRYSRVDGVKMDPAKSAPFVTLYEGKDATLWQDPLVTELRDSGGNIVKISEGAPLELTSAKLVEAQTTNARGEKTGATFHVFSQVNLLGKKDVSGWIENGNLIGCAFSGGSSGRCTPLQTASSR